MNLNKEPQKAHSVFIFKQSAEQMSYSSRVITNVLDEYRKNFKPGEFYEGASDEIKDLLQLLEGDPDLNCPSTMV